MMEGRFCLFLVVVWLSISVVHSNIMDTCSRMDMMQMRAILEQAIENARASLARQKQLNEYLSSIGELNTSTQ